MSLAYAVQHPEGVGRLILYGGFADGHQVASAKVRTAMIELVRAHWGSAELLAQCYEIRVDGLLDRVAAPTLVLHRREAAEEDDDEPAPEPSPGIHLERDDRTR